MKPDFSGEWILDRQASTLRITAHLGAVARIRKRFKASRRVHLQTTEPQSEKRNAFHGIVLAVAGPERGSVQDHRGRY
jgi:hypothetical protein